MEDSAIIDRFRRAAFGMDDWQGALRSLADATRARVVHLSGLDAAGAPVFSMIHGATPDMLGVYLEEGGFDPRNNPRTRAGVEGPMLRAVVDEQLVAERERDAFSIFGNLFERVGADRSVLARLDIPRVHGTIVVMRPSSFAGSGCREPHLLASIAPALSEIVGQALQLGHQQDGTVLSTAEALDASVLLLDGMRRIVLMSQPVEAWLERDGPLTVRAGKVRARDPASETAFAAAIAHACDPGQSRRPGRKVVLRTPVTNDARGGERIIVTVGAVPHRPSGPLARARVMVSSRMVQAASGDLYADLFDLTRAEAQIAVLLAQGQDLAAIAALRNCSVLTVRTQIKALFGKTDTNRQSALVARLHAAGR